MQTTSKPVVGFLGLTLDLYETLVPEARPSREKWVRQELLPYLSPIADVRFQEAAFTVESINTAIRDFETQNVDVVMIVCLTYSPSQLVLPALKTTRLPILIWNTQELWGVDENYSGEEMVGNHGVHGTQDLCNVLRRSGVEFSYITSHVDDSNCLSQLEDYFVAASVKNRLVGAKLGIIGYPFPGMGDFAVDTTHLVATLGCLWENIPLEEYVHLTAAAEADDVKRLVDEYRKTYDVAETITDTDLEYTARVETAMRKIVDKRNLIAITYQFSAFGEYERTETLPFVAISRMMAEGIGFGGEGDIIASIGTWMLDKLCCPASFSEIFTMDFAGNSVFLSHMGEANIALARKGSPIPLIARSSPITRTRRKQLVLQTTFEPGEATLFALTQGPAGKWKLIASHMEIPDFPQLESLEVPQFKLTPEMDIRDWLTAYAKAGGPHHNAVCFGDATKRLEIMAGLLNADFVKI